MKIFDITGKNTKITEVKQEFIHKCADCSFFTTCEKNGDVNQHSIACEKFV
jgi:hypothetical protein